MRILLDCRFKKGAGPNIVTQYILDALIKLNMTHKFVILQNSNQALPDYPGIRKVIVPFKNNLLAFLWVQFYLPILLTKLNIDVYHSLKHFGPLFSAIPRIEYVHEVGHFFPEGLKAFKLNLFNRIYLYHLQIWSLKRATHIIGVSQQCKDVITQKFGIPDKRMSVIYCGLDKKFRPISDQSAVLKCCEKYGIFQDYILCVGNICAQENYDNVIKMYSRLRDGNKEIPKLVMVGATGNAETDFLKAITQLKLAEHVILTGFVEHDDLVYLYNGASLLLFPPTVAAFGIPPIEAMACGTPVVASNIGAIPEISGGSTFLFNDPKNVDAMLEAVKYVLHSDEIRQNLRQKGLQRAKTFSWEFSASQIFQLYEYIGNNKT